MNEDVVLSFSGIPSHLIFYAFYFSFQKNKRRHFQKYQMKDHEKNQFQMLCHSNFQHWLYTLEEHYSQNLVFIPAYVKRNELCARYNVAGGFEILNLHELPPCLNRYRHSNGKDEISLVASVAT